jgi:hypothetical protein
MEDGEICILKSSLLGLFIQCYLDDQVEEKWAGMQHLWDRREVCRRFGGET